MRGMDVLAINRPNSHIPTTLSVALRSFLCAILQPMHPLEQFWWHFKGMVDMERGRDH